MPPILPVVPRLALATFCAILAAPALAHAQPAFGGGFHHGPPMLEGVTLTDAQRTQIHALMKASRDDSKALRGQLRTVQEQIETTMLSAGDVTVSSLAPLVQQRESLMQQLAAKRLATDIAVRNLLTASQLATASATHAKLASLHEQEHALHAEGAPGGGPDGAPGFGPPD